jgi:hypothetical protein
MLCAAPNNKWLSGALDLDDKGFVLTGDSVVSMNRVGHTT